MNQAAYLFHIQQSSIWPVGAGICLKILITSMIGEMNAFPIEGSVLKICLQKHPTK